MTPSSAALPRSSSSLASDSYEPRPTIIVDAQAHASQPAACACTEQLRLKTLRGRLVTFGHVGRTGASRGEKRVSASLH